MRSYVLQINAIWFENFKGLLQNSTDKVPDLSGWRIGYWDVRQVTKHEVKLSSLFDVTIQRYEAIANDNLSIGNKIDIKILITIFYYYLLTS